VQTANYQFALNKDSKNCGSSVVCLAFDFFQGSWGGGTSYLTNISAGVWTHVAAVYNNDTNTIRFYKNGTFTESIPTTPSLITNNNNLTIGRGGDADSGYFNGKLDEIGIWNRALSSDDIYSLFNGSRILIANCSQAGAACINSSTCCSGLLCQNHTCKVAPATTTTTIMTTTTTKKSTTTTIIAKADCPADCCVNEQFYYDLECPEGQECVENSCVSPGTNLYYVILIIVIILIVTFVVFLFFTRRRGGKSEWAWLYKKWSRKKRR
jgi:hypothetical protein